MRPTLILPTRFPLAARVVIIGSAMMSCTYYGLWLWNAAYLPWWQANLALAIAAGVLTAALDMLKPLFLTVAQLRWQAKHRLASIAPAAMALLLALVSMWAVDGLLLKLRADSSTAPANAITQWDRKTATLRKSEADLKALAPSRPVAEISAAMGKVPINLDVFRRTGQCTDITKPESQQACAPLLDLRAEMARANRKEQLEQEIRTTTTWLDANQRPASADPQLATYAALTGTSESFVALVVALTVGLALELVSLFGPVLLTVPPAKEAPTPATLEPVAVAPEAPAIAPPLQLADHRPKRLRKFGE